MRSVAGRRRAVGVLLAVAAATGATALAGCSGNASGASSSGKIVAVGAENEYANVIQQVGGKYVQASAIMSNPNTDPHTFEASAAVAREVGSAELVVQNGVYYDTFMSTIENAAPNSDRKVIDVQKLLGLPNSTPNPHLWYNPITMPKVADAIASDLSALQPSHASYFQANAKAFISSLTAWNDGDRELQGRLPGDPGRYHGTGSRLHAASGGRGQHDAVYLPGRHHERRRPVAAERRHGEVACSPSTRSRSSCTTSR